MAEDYPVRGPYYAHKLTRLMLRACAAQEMGPDACLLVSYIAHTEDAKRYTGAVTFWNEQIMPIMGFNSWGQLDRCRSKAVDAGWLHYEAGGKGKVGRYWTTIPSHLAGLGDDSVDCDAHVSFSKNGDQSVEEPWENRGTSGEHSTLSLSLTSTSEKVVGVDDRESDMPIKVHDADRPVLAEDFARIVSTVGVAKSPTQKAKDRELFFKAAVLARQSLGRDWLEDALRVAGDKIRAGDINNKRALFFGICRQLATDRGKQFERELKRVQVPRWVNERKESASDRETTTA